MAVKKVKLTRWFPASVKPARQGVYERKYGPTIAYSRWDGKRWMAGSYEFEYAKRAWNPSWQSALPWRGLAEQPK